MSDFNKVSVKIAADGNYQVSGSAAAVKELVDASKITITHSIRPGYEGTLTKKTEVTYRSGSGNVPSSTASQGFTPQTERPVNLDQTVELPIETPRKNYFS